MEENTNKGLTKKTKSELIEIILRKDEVDRECRTEISNLKKRIKGYDTDIEGMTEQSKADKSIIDKQANMLIEKENLIEGMKSQFDISATEVAEAKEEIAKYKLYVKGLSFICIILIVILTFELLVF